MQRFGSRGSSSAAVSGRRARVDKEKADKLWRSLGSIQQQGISKEDIVNQYKSMTIEMDERQARPPPEPPPWSARESKVWKKINEICLDSVLFCLCFSFELHVVSSVFLFPSRKILEFRSGDEKSGLPVIGSVPITESTNFISSTEVIDSKSESRADDKQKDFYHFVSCFFSNCIVNRVKNILLI
ncbi:unnamed protein product [Cuscuta europaea]|uniref:Uncharacterized protein n=1 Tax=Cuscuta europaea TaxID=41803 RepID=A0A9P0ZBE0_CUSEU|nr:unnamed protein product [Cuscuta europaea]